MHILLAVPEYPPHNIGGGGEVYQQLAENYTKMGHKVTVIFGYYKSASWNEQIVSYSAEGIDFYQVPEIPYPKNMPNLRTAMPIAPAVSRELSEIISKIAPDIAHIHGYGWPFVNSIASKCRKNGIPYIYTLHGYPETQSNSNPLFKLLWTLFVKLYQEKNLQTAVKITAISDYIKNDPRNVAQDKSITIYNGIDIEKYAYPGDRISVREVNEIDADTVFIYSLGRLAEMKGFQEMIKLIPDLSEAGIRVKYLIAGEDDGYKPSLEKLIQSLELGDQVELVGNHDLDTKIQYIHQCDFFAIPSLWEPFGLVALEGAIYHKPIITSNAGGLAEVLADYPAKIDMYGEEFVDILRSYKPVDFEFGMERFNWVSITNEYLEILEQTTTKL